MAEDSTSAIQGAEWHRFLINLNRPALNQGRTKTEYMKNLRHPNFILSIVSAIFLFVGIGMRANGYQGGDYVLGIGTLLAGIHWIWAIIDVATRSDMRPYQKRFWLIIVIAVPVFGAMVFYGMHQARNKITT
jgi:hypothetical protein